MSLLTTDIVDIALVYGQFSLFLIELLQSLIREERISGSAKDKAPDRATIKELVWLLKP